MINDRLIWFLESNNLIFGNRAGFRKDYSTNNHLVRLESFIRDAFIKKEHCVAIFFDLGKCVNDADSSLYVDDFGIFYKSKNMENIEFRLQRCHVDDFGIFYKSKNMENIEFRLQRCLNKVETWATENGFKFSKTKTQCVHFCQLRALHPDPVLNIYGSPIPVVEEAKFLGLLFDKKLSFIPYIKALKAKCLKALDILKVLSNTNWGGDRSVLLNLYRSVGRSKLDYGSIVYGSARKSYLKCLDTIHHQGLGLALGAFRTSPVESLYAESNKPSLYIRREKSSLQYTTKLAANPKNPAHNCVFNPKYERFYSNTPSAIKLSV